MAFTISMGSCSCENEVVDKKDYIQWITGAENVSAQMVNTDILNPVLKVLGGRSNCNYVYIKDFGERYYFVESVESVAGGHVLLRCHVDVLYTYKANITALTCLVSRNEFDENPYLVDSLLPIQKQFTVYAKAVGAIKPVTASGIFEYYILKIAN